MQMKIVLYDDYYDIPLRGVVQTPSGKLAFVASLEEDLADRLCTKMTTFECDETLISLFREQNDMFLAWRAKFDQGVAEKSTHPLLVDERYQQLCRRIDEAFARLSSPVSETTGTIDLISGKWVFELL